MVRRSVFLVFAILFSVAQITQAARIEITPVTSGGGAGTPGGSNTQVQYNNSSSFGGITNATTDGTTLSVTSPKIITAMNDTNANELMKVTATASAVNEITLANGATANNPTLSATGDDSNVGINLTPKGTGGVVVGGTYQASANGQFGYEGTTQSAFQVYASGVNQNLSGSVWVKTADTTSATSTAEDALLDTGVGTKTLPANFFVIGKTVRVTLRGKYSNTLTPTLRLKIKLGSNIMVDTGAQTTITGASNAFFEITGDMTCRTTGGSGTIEAMGRAMVSSAAVTSAVWESSVVTAVTVDTTASQAVGVTAQWGTSSGSNTITGMTATIEVLN